MTEGRYDTKTLVKGAEPTARDFKPLRVRSWRWTLAAAVTGLVVILGQGHLIPPPHPVILPPHILASAGSRAIPVTVSQLLVFGASLRLTMTQLKRLQAISDAETVACHPLYERIRQDQQQFDRFVRSARTQGGATLADLQSQGQPAIADTKVLAEVQQEYWNKALRELTPMQRIKAARQWGVGHAPKAAGGNNQ